jgi:hypothetical protein
MNIKQLEDKIAKKKADLHKVETTIIIFRDDVKWSNMAEIDLKKFESALADYTHLTYELRNLNTELHRLQLRNPLKVVKEDDQLTQAQLQKELNAAGFTNKIWSFFRQGNKLCIKFEKYILASELACLKKRFSQDVKIYEDSLNRPVEKGKWVVIEESNSNP